MQRMKKNYYIIQQEATRMADVNPVQSTNSKKSFDLFQFLYKYGTILTIFILIAVFAASNPAFIQGNNIINFIYFITSLCLLCVIPATFSNINALGFIPLTIRTNS